MNLRVASFNIRNGDADDGPDSWKFRRNSTVEAIRRLDAGVVGLQEVMKPQLDFILENLPEYGYVGVGRIDGLEMGEFAPILFRRNELVPRRHGWFMLSESPDTAGSKSWDTACERICTWAELDGWTVFNTHLDHVSEEARVRGAQLILSRTPDSALVMGDFNCLPDDPPVRAFLDAGFVDAGAADPQSTFHDWENRDGGRIDYLFARGLQIGGYETLSGRIGGRHASDHFAISATVGFELRT